ncbi:MAG: hypothetical protein K1X55_17925, partial [Chitinophagales bacterium]|nr:hypothetical protein [Chitinophagales bacterium]
ELADIRKEMTLSEISHLIGVVFVTFFAAYKGFSKCFLFGFFVMLVNVLMNLYPSLLQQENKRRIDKLMLSRRGIIESANDFLMTVFDIDHTRHRSPINAVTHMLGAALAYSFYDSKPAVFTQHFSITSKTYPKLTLF